MRERVLFIINSGFVLIHHESDWCLIKSTFKKTFYVHVKLRLLEYIQRYIHTLLTQKKRNF